MHWIGLVVAAGLTVTASAWAGGTDPLADAWRGTDLDFSLSKHFVSNEHCNSNPEYYSSCVAAVHAANKLLSDPVPLDETTVNFDQALQEMAARLPREIPLQMLLGTAINAHLQAFDAHAYLRPSAYDNGAVFTPGYAGIGVILRKLDSGFQITEVAANSPASTNGLKPGDIITSVSGIPAADLEKDSVDDLIRTAAGEPGTPLTLSYVRGRLKYTLTLLREPVDTPNVEFSTLPDEPNLGVIRIHHFYAGATCEDVRMALMKFDGSGLKQLMIDLRDNGGGATLDALCVAGIFVGAQNQVGIQYIGVKIPEQQLINVFNTSSDITWMKGYAFNARPLPLVVLVNGNTASAAEIVAGALQANGAAWIVGQQTYGKGSVQTTTPLFMHSTLTIAATTSRFYFPNLLSNQRVGISPSFSVPFSPDIPEPMVKREGEAYPTSLPAVNLPWPDSRLDRIAEIKTCIASQYLDRAEFGKLGADYQKAYGIAVLKCDGSPK